VKCLRVLWLFFVGNMLISACFGVSVVYNLRIAETSKRQATEPLITKPFVLAQTVFEQNRTTYDGIHQNFAGTLSSGIFLKDTYYVKVDWAFGNAASRFEALHLSRTQTDDIVVTSGYSFTLNEHAKITFSGLVGFPTHNDLGLQGAQIGTGHYGLGVQWDGSFTFAHHANHSLRAAARSVHFFERTISSNLLGFNQRYRVAPGDLIDFLVAHHVNHDKHRMEFGYNSSFLVNAKICPDIEAVRIRSTYIRSSFYATYAYFFMLAGHLSGVACAFSGGFDHLPKKVGTQRVLTAWALWGINF